MKIETIKKNAQLTPYFSTIRGVVELFYPFVEGAVHDLKSGQIVALFNNFSKRSVGDKSPLHELKVRVDQFPDVFQPYYKINWDGKKLKCTSITIRDSKNIPIGLICFNFDVSAFGEMSHVLQNFLSVGMKSSNPVDLYSDNWEEKTRTFIKHYLYEKGLILSKLSSQNKKDLVQCLYVKGYMNYKYAARYIARYLNVSRATIYNYLK
ncbi:PAS domain-containing protein [bacterium]|nr:PAS domain-containing protein [bacterium]